MGYCELHYICYLPCASRPLQIKHLHQFILFKFHLLMFCWQMFLKFVSKMLTDKSFNQPVPFGWLCSSTLSGEHKHQLQINRNVRGTLEEVSDPKDTASKPNCHCKFINISLGHEELQEERAAFGQWWFHVCKPSPQREIKDCLQSTSIYLLSAYHG